LDTDFSFGLFTGNESIVGDGGQTGYLFGGLQSGFVTSTGWGSIFNNRIYFGSNRNRYCN
jgi:hypothetical protein